MTPEAARCVRDLCEVLTRQKRLYEQLAEARKYGETHKIGLLEKLVAHARHEARFMYRELTGHGWVLEDVGKPEEAA